jgi:hypothetical protein
VAVSDVDLRTHLRLNQALRDVTEVADAVMSRAMAIGVHDEPLAILLARLSRVVAAGRDRIDPRPYSPEYLPPDPTVRRRAETLAAIGTPFAQPTKGPR